MLLRFQCKMNGQLFTFIAGADLRRTTLFTNGARWFGLAGKFAFGFGRSSPGATSASAPERWRVPAPLADDSS